MQFCRWQFHPDLEFLGIFVHAGDELHFPLELQAANARTEIYIRNTNARERRQDTFQAEIGYATQPRKTSEAIGLFSQRWSAVVWGSSAIHLGCDALRDYFYIGNRRRAWDRQPSLYQLLRVDPKAEPAELRLAFKLRALELRAADASAGDLRALERAFNILAHPELRACYDGLLNDREALHCFPMAVLVRCWLPEIARVTGRASMLHASSRFCRNTNRGT